MTERRILIIGGGEHEARMLRDLLETQRELVPGAGIVVVSHEDAARDQYREGSIGQSLTEHMRIRVEEQLKLMTVLEPRQPHPGERRFFKRKKGRS